MLFFSFLREVPEITPLQGRLIIVHVQKTFILLLFNKFLNKNGLTLLEISMSLTLHKLYLLRV